MSHIKKKYFKIFYIKTCYFQYIIFINFIILSVADDAISFDILRLILYFSDNNEFIQEYDAPVSIKIYYIRLFTLQSIIK